MLWPTVLYSHTHTHTLSFVLHTEHWATWLCAPPGWGGCVCVCEDKWCWFIWLLLLALCWHSSAAHLVHEQLFCSFVSLRFFFFLTFPFWCQHFYLTPAAPERRHCLCHRCSRSDEAFSVSVKSPHVCVSIVSMALRRVDLTETSPHLLDGFPWNRFKSACWFSFTLFFLADVLFFTFVFVAPGTDAITHQTLPDSDISFRFDTMTNVPLPVWFMK